MRRVFVIAAAAAVLGAVPAVQALGGSSTPAAGCGATGPAVATRGVVPALLTLPAGIRFTWADASTLVGQAPHALRAEAAAFRASVARAGLATTWQDAEFGEAEARFSGFGITGSWRVNAISGCANGSVVTLSFASRGAPAAS